MSAADSLMEAVQHYLWERRQLGFALISLATELKRFARFAESRGHEGPITQELQITWAREHVHLVRELVDGGLLERDLAVAPFDLQFTGLHSAHKRLHQLTQLLRVQVVEVGGRVAHGR